ncbi:MAG: Gfo/Idh/MocA family oxidoreductase [Cyclobacteriaceae bacterium]|nr:Gfo/Idh/MocA family oxidoreductase [Cyclobacteriaceae bacterium]
MKTIVKNIDRRKFVKTSAASAAAFMIVPRHVLGGVDHVAPSDTLYIAGIGVGGKGKSDLTSMAKSPNAKIAFLCDADDRMAVDSRNTFPEAPYFRDFREMLDKEGKNIDAVTVSTPDHTHAVAAMAAMQLGKHVYVQKPLTHSIKEARMLTEAARKYKVVTQMGNQYASDEPVRRTQEIIDAGLIGEVSKVYAWTNRPVWPQGIPTPQGSFDIPGELDWDLWLGPAAEIDFNPAYLPFNWRGWWAFGTGALGDMACHILDPFFRIFPVDYPTEVECSATTAWEGFFKVANYKDSCPSSSIIHLKFPRTDGKGDIKLIWMDGGLLPPRPEELEPDEDIGDFGNGFIFEGTKGKVFGNYNKGPILLPTSRMAEVEALPKTLKRVPEGHYVDWVNACLQGFGKAELSSPFDYAGPLTEAVLMGNLALRSYLLQEKDGRGRPMYPGRKKLLWDAQNMKITNFDSANEYVMRQYRSGWTLNN